MFSSLPDIVVVLIAAIASMLIGMFWYSPQFFAKPWMRALGLSNKKLSKAKQKGMGATYAMSFAGALVQAFVLKYFIDGAMEPGILRGVITAVWVWLGFTTTVQLTQFLFEHHSWSLYMINTGYQLVSLLVMGGVLGALG